MYWCCGQDDKQRTTSLSSRELEEAYLADRSAEVTIMKGHRSYSLSFQGKALSTSPTYTCTEIVEINPINMFISKHTVTRTRCHSSLISPLFFLVPFLSLPYPHRLCPSPHQLVLHFQTFLQTCTSGTPNTTPRGGCVADHASSLSWKWRTRLHCREREKGERERK